MWTQKLLSVLVLISLSQAHTLPQKLIPATNAEDIREGVYVLDGGDDNRRGFVITRDTTPDGVKVSAGFQLFEIPIGPQFSYIREKEANEESVRKASRAAFIPEEPGRRSEKVSAGLTLFGIPLGPQLSYKSNKNEDGTGTEADVFTVFGPLIAKFERIVKKLVNEYVMA